MDKLTRIIIGGKSLPIKMDLNVLEHIQNEFGTVNEFERKILGLEIARDEKGKVIYDENEKPVMIATEPSVKAIIAALPSMINEGLAIEAEEMGKSWEAVSDLWVQANCNIAFETLADIIHKEFKRCFEIKKL